MWPLGVSRDGDLPGSCWRFDWAPVLIFRICLQCGQGKHIVFSSLLSSQPPSSGLQSSLGPLDTLQPVDKSSNLQLKLLLNVFPMVSHTVSSTSAFYSCSAHTVRWMQKQRTKERLRSCWGEREQGRTGQAAWTSKPASQGSVFCFASLFCISFLDREIHTDHL